MRLRNFLGGVCDAMVVVGCIGAFLAVVTSKGELPIGMIGWPIVVLVLFVRCRMVERAFDRLKATTERLLQMVEAVGKPSPVEVCAPVIAEEMEGWHSRLMAKLANEWEELPERTELRIALWSLTEVLMPGSEPTVWKMREVRRAIDLFATAGKVFGDEATTTYRVRKERCNQGTIFIFTKEAA